MNKNIIIEKYNDLLKKLKIDEHTSSARMNQIIKNSLYIFCKKHKNPAIWCFGKHTRMLMADFMNEMKNVKIIIDASQNGLKNTGFQIISSDEIEKYEIDGIIISSYVYKDEIKNELSKNHKTIAYLDIYEQLALEGIILKSSYFSISHPYSKYQVINELQIHYHESRTTKDRINYLKKIIDEYILIKDFKTAIKYTRNLIKLSKDDKDKILLQDLNNLYELEKKQISKINSENVLMLCIDGLRRQDLLGGKLPNLLCWAQNSSYFFDHAYSSSTSTYESLIPVYSSNHDMRTQYYKKNILSKTECSFISKACKQKRKNFFYTDTEPYVDCEEIKMSGSSQTVTEKIWDFMKDASNENNGLFYIHLLYESHYSYPNPYTKSTLIADGSNIMFDFLDAKGGTLRTDYVKQQKDALQYIDDVLSPFLELLTCRIVLYADHGNILMKNTDTLEYIDTLKYSCHKDLIEIPLMIKCPELRPQRDHRLISLMELNNIIICLLEKNTFRYVEPQYIKVQRSRIYNPDFQYLYKKYGRERELQAFELFIFSDNIQLIVYENGDWGVLPSEQTLLIDKDALYQSIVSEITVCEKHTSFQN